MNKFSDLSSVNIEKQNALFRLKLWIPKILEKLAAEFAIKDYREALPKMNERDARFLMAKVTEYMAYNCRQPFTAEHREAMQAIRQMIDTYLIDIVSRKETAKP